MNAHVAVSVTAPAIADAAFLHTLQVLGLDKEITGSPAWWERVRQRGTPLVTGRGNGEAELTFLWRDPGGNEQTSVWQCVFIDVWSHTPHPTRQPTALRRLPGTDVWYWQTQLSDDWCGSYVLLPAQADQLPPEHNAAATGSDYAAAVRRWWCALLDSNGCADDLNPLPPHRRAWGGELSPIQLEGAPVHPVWSAVAGQPPRGHLHHWRWRSELLHNERDVWLYRTGPAAADLPLVILLDGHYWARSRGFLAALDQLTAAGTLPAAVYLLIDALDADTRARELPCNPEFWLLLQQELLPQAQSLEPFTAAAEKTLIAGQSFGGLSALYAALNWPQRFGAVLSQSGSFWWPDVNEIAANGWLTRQVRAAGSRRDHLRIDLSVGHCEDSMLGVNRAMYDALQAAGARVRYHEFRGGHDWLCWRDDLLRGLSRLLSAGI